MSGPPWSPGDTVIGPGVCVIVSRYVPVPSKPLSKLRDKHQIGAGDGRDDVVDLGRSQPERRAEGGAVRRPQPNPRPEVVRVGDLADVHGDALARGGRERPHVQVALKDLAGVDRAVGQRPALVAGRHRDRARRLRHRQPIGAGAVEAAVEAGDEHQIGARDGRDDIVDLGRGQAGCRAERGAGRRPQPNPRPEVVRLGDLADVHGDPFARGGRERPHVHVALQNLARVDRAVGQRPALVARRHRDRPRRVRHRQPIGARAVEAAVEAGDQHQIRARDRRDDIVDRGRIQAGR